MNEEFKKKNPASENEDIEALRAYAMRYRQEKQKRVDYDKQVENIRAGWAKDIEAMKKFVPGFVFERAMENKEFYNLVMQGVSIPIAYIAITNKEPAGQRRIIAQNAQSNSAHNGAIDQSVENMSDEDFDKYLKKIKER